MKPIAWCQKKQRRPAKATERKEKETMENTVYGIRRLVATEQNEMAGCKRQGTKQRHHGRMKEWHACDQKQPHACHHTGSDSNKLIDVVGLRKHVRDKQCQRQSGNALRFQLKVRKPPHKQQQHHTSGERENALGYSVLESGMPNHRSAPMSLLKYLPSNCIFCASWKLFFKASALSAP